MHFDVINEKKPNPIFFRDLLGYLLYQKLAYFYKISKSVLKKNAFIQLLARLKNCRI